MQDATDRRRRGFLRSSSLAAGAAVAPAGLVSLAGLQFFGEAAIDPQSGATAAGASATEAARGRPRTMRCASFVRRTRGAFGCCYV